MKPTLPAFSLRPPPVLDSRRSDVQQPDFSGGYGSHEGHGLTAGGYMRKRVQIGSLRHHRVSKQKMAFGAFVGMSLCEWRLGSVRGVK